MTVPEVLEYCVIFREKVVQEKEELIHQEDNIQHDIVENVEKCRIEEAKFQSNVEKCSKVGRLSHSLRDY